MLLYPSSLSFSRKSGIVSTSPLSPPSIPDPPSQSEGGGKGRKMMKSAGILAASMAAVNAISSLTASKSINPCLQHQQDAGAIQQRHTDYSSDKFAPRFDGLRFIETLVTAHR